MSNNDLAIRFFLQLAFIVATCRVVGLLAKRVGQPQVVAEMIAGVLMGPSLFGLLLPGVQGYLFPKTSMSIIYAVSQVGLVLYMFLIGLEFQVDVIRQRLRSAVTVSLAGIVLPFTLGAIISTFLIRNHSFFTEGVVGWEAALFMGAAMSITAFPMLARIIYERGLTGTSLGTLALAAGSIDDAAACASWQLCWPVSAVRPRLPSSQSAAACSTLWWFCLPASRCSEGLVRELKARAVLAGRCLPSY